MERITKLGSFHGQNYNIGYAQGFLEGLNSPDALQRKEVWELVEALKKIDLQCLPELSDDLMERSMQLAGLWTSLKIIAHEALSKFKEAAKL